MAGRKQNGAKTRRGGFRSAPYLTASSVTVVTGSTILINTKEGDRNAYKVSKAKVPEKAFLSSPTTAMVAPQEKIPPPLETSSSEIGKDSFSIST